MINSDEQVKLQFGAQYKFINNVSCDINRIIVSDGEYEYVISSKSTSRHISERSMTYESKLKYYTSLCLDGLCVLGFRRNNFNIVATILHKETGQCFEKRIKLKNFNDACIQILSKINRVDQYKNILKLRFGDKFDCSKMEYVSCFEKMIVICPFHGEFKISANEICGNTYICAKCAREISCGFNKGSFLKQCANGIGYLYVLECYNDNERFIKIGITSKKNIKGRFPGQCAMPYTYSMVYFISADSSFAYDIEVKCKRYFKQKKYKPKISFAGRTECFDISIKQEAICFIQKLLLTSPDVN